MVAARLANAGVATKLVLRAGSPRWRAVDDGHLRVHVSGAAPMTSFVAAASDAADADVVVLATKVWQARDALLAATPPPTAPVVVLSNGALALLDEIPGVAAAATTHGCFETAAFQTTHAGAGTIWVADAKAHGVFSRVEALNSTLVSSDEMTARLWRKLAVARPRGFGVATAARWPSDPRRRPYHPSHRCGVTEAPRVAEASWGRRNPTASSRRRRHPATPPRLPGELRPEPADGHQALQQRRRARDGGGPRDGPGGRRGARGRGRRARRRRGPLRRRRRLRRRERGELFVHVLSPRGSSTVAATPRPRIFRAHDARRRRDRDAEILVETGARPRYQDCRLGRPTEVDFLSGWVVARARARGSDAPENARLADAVRGLEAW